MFKVGSIVLSLLTLAFNSPAWPATSQSFSLLWTLSDGLDKPESVIYDAKRDRLYVSNVKGNPPEKDGEGYISTVSLTGQLLQREWVKNLNAPKGMAIVGDVLYVSDIDVLVAIDIEKNQVMQRYEANNARFLNDVTADEKDNVYVSDMFTNTIYCLCDNQFTIWLEDAALAGPNGLVAAKDRLIVGSWGVLKGEGFATTTAGYLQTVDYITKKVTPFGKATPVGHLDGVTADGADGYYATDWVAGRLFHFDVTGTVQEIMRLKQGSADHTYLIKDNLLLIPMMMDNQLQAFKRN